MSSKACLFQDGNLGFIAERGMEDDDDASPSFGTEMDWDSNECIDDTETEMMRTVAPNIMSSIVSNDDSDPVFVTKSVLRTALQRAIVLEMVSVPSDIVERVIRNVVMSVSDTSSFSPITPLLPHTSTVPLLPQTSIVPLLHPPRSALTKKAPSQTSTPTKQFRPGAVASVGGRKRFREEILDDPMSKELARRLAATIRAWNYPQFQVSPELVRAFQTLPEWKWTVDSKSERFQGEAWVRFLVGRHGYYIQFPQRIPKTDMSILRMVLVSNWNDGDKDWIQDHRRRFRASVRAVAWDKHGKDVTSQEVNGVSIGTMKKSPHCEREHVLHWELVCGNYCTGFQFSHLSIETCVTTETIWFAWCVEIWQDDVVYDALDGLEDCENLCDALPMTSVTHKTTLLATIQSPPFQNMSKRTWCGKHSLIMPGIEDASLAT